jgi:Protein of unknown function (DUF2892)
MTTQSHPLRGRLRRGWPLERVLFTMAGGMILLSVVLSVLVSPWFLLLTAFVGLNQLAFAAVGDCPTSLLLRRGCGLKGAGE